MNIHHKGFYTADRPRIAIVGSGISGAAAAWALNPTADVILFEAAKRPGGHTATVDIDYDGVPLQVDTGFIVYNELNYPELTALFQHLGVNTLASDMGFSLSLDDGRMEWCGSSFRQIFTQRKNILSPSFLWMIKEILRFNSQCLKDRADGLLADISIGQYLELRNYSQGFIDNYLVPMAAAIWSTPRLLILDFPAETFVTFFDNHRLLHNRRPEWRTVQHGSRNYLKELLTPLGSRLRLDTPVKAIVRDEAGVQVFSKFGQEFFDSVIMASHADQTLAMLGDASAKEHSILSSFSYCRNEVVLHRDKSLMPRRKNAWTSWNYLRNSDDNGKSNATVTYWMNQLQAIDEKYPVFVTLNPQRAPKTGTVFGEFSYDHPLFDQAAIKAQSRLPEIQGKNNTWFAGAWTGYGFHEDGLRSGLDAAQALGAAVPWREKSLNRQMQLAIAAE